MELKERINIAVIEEFNKSGLKFTMDDISKNLGISKRTLYTVVKDKNTLFLEAVDEVFRSIKESEKEILDDNSLDVVDKLRRILVVLPKKYQTIDFRQLYELKANYPKVYEKMESRLETDWEPTFQVLEQAIGEGRIKDISFPVFQSMISGTIEHYLSHTILIENRIPYEKALQDMLDIIFDGMLKQK